MSRVWVQRLKRNVILQDLTPSSLPTLARALKVSLEELMGEPITKANRRGPAPKLAQHMERISKLPRTQQQFVIRMIDMALAQQGR